MTNNKKTVQLLLILLFISMTAAVIGFMGKGQSSPVIALFMYNKDANYENERLFNSTPFWDNYPYWVLMSKGKEFPGEIKVKREIGLELSLNELLQKGGPYFFRYRAAQKDDSIVLNTWGMLKESELKMSIITDIASIKHLKEKGQYTLFEQNIYVSTEPLPIAIEKSRLSYFFRVKNNKIEDLFVPRIEIPEVTKKYFLALKGLN